MAAYSLTYIFLISLIYLPSLITAQQPYADDNCPPPRFNNATSVLGYSCNGVDTSCLSFLIYRAQPSYNTISSIATLLSANATQMSAINNNISENMALATDTQVIVPIQCSCSGRFYQANATHIVQAGDNYYVMTNNIFRGLTTCNAIQTQKSSPNIVNVFPNDRLTIPLRCACPTTTQVDQGIRYLMTFVIKRGNTISGIANKFGATLEQTFEANEKSEEDSVIQPFTTLLVPLQNPPNASVMEYPAFVPPPLSSPPSLPPTSLPSPRSSGEKTRNWVFFGLGVVAGGVFIITFAGIIFFFMCMRKKNNPIMTSKTFEAQENARANLPSGTETESLEFLESISKIASLKVYSFKDIQAATQNFNADHWIEGSVFKGILNDDEVAIKKMDGDVSKEISVLNKINHFNLIKLLGVCFQNGVWYFVYEYAENGPLSDWIYQENPNRGTLSWGKRMQVACDVATGLNYLHSYTSPPHVHKDIKSENVFLSHEFRGKIAKFGLSRPVRGNDGLFTLTTHIEGTKGYLAPEYLENGVISPMLDVYAFGVLLLEMLTGKDVAHLYEGIKVHLSEILGPVLSAEDGISSTKKLIDSSLGEDYPADVANTMLVVIDRCLSKEPGSRPSMDEIVRVLSKTLTTSLVWGSSTSVSISSSRSL